MIDTKKTYDALAKLFTQEQAEAITDILKDDQKNLITKEYLDAKIATLDTQIKIGLGLAVAIFIKSFF